MISLYSYDYSYNTAQSPIAALEWTKVIVKYCLTNLETDQSSLMKDVIVAQALLLTSVTKVSCPR